MTFLPRHKPWHGPLPTGPFVGDARTYDIPETIGAMIRNAAPNCVAVTLRPIGSTMIATAEREARRKGIRIIWVLFRKRSARP